MKIRIAILSEGSLYDRSTSISGSLIQLDFLSKGFSKYGIEVHFISSFVKLENMEKESNSGIIYHWIKKKRSLLDWKLSLFEYEKKLHSIKPNVIYIRGRSSLQHVARKYKTNKKCIYIWGTNGSDSPELWKKIKSLESAEKSIIKKILLFPFFLYQDYFINEGMKGADIIINQTLQQKASTKNNLNKEGIVIPNYFPHTSIEYIKNKENKILWLASLSANKQPEKFISLIEELDLNGWKVLLAGDTCNEDYRQRIKQECKKKSIQFFGNVKFVDSNKLYQQTRLYICTSVKEGFPNAYIQSWLSGNPVLSLNHDPNGWFEEYEVGYCFNGDFDKLKEKLQFLINNPSIINQMGEKAKKFATEKFTSKKIIERYISIFKNNHV